MVVKEGTVGGARMIMINSSAVRQTVIVHIVLHLAAAPGCHTCSLDVLAAKQAAAMIQTPMIHASILLSNIILSPKAISSSVRGNGELWGELASRANMFRDSHGAGEMTSRRCWAIARIEHHRSCKRRILSAQKSGAQ